MARKKTVKPATLSTPRKSGWPKGRARIPVTQRLTAGKQVELHFLTADYARIEAAAHRSDRLITEFIREAVLAALPRNCVNSSGKCAVLQTDLNASTEPVAIYQVSSSLPGTNTGGNIR